MNTIIAGSRSITDYNAINDAVNASGFAAEITTVISGIARGVDQLGETWACNHNIKVRHFPANWELHGRAAGYIRNAQMAQIADAAIIVWDGSSQVQVEEPAQSANSSTCTCKPVRNK